MKYFITGATGFIGRFVVARLLTLSDDNQIFALVRPGSEYKLDAIRERLGVDPKRLVPIRGDITQKMLGISKRDRDDLKGRIDHFFHLAAVYNLNADENTLRYTNIEGTRYALKLAEEMSASCFHHMSSTAAAGIYDGTFTEDMFEEAGKLQFSYMQTKHESEKIVREECSLPYRIYRPSMVVGDSTTGEMDKIDGPYYLFKLVQKLGDFIPAWFPLINLEGGYFNIVPVDYVANALVHIAHQPKLDNRCFHLTADRDYHLGEIMNIIAGVADAPKASLQVKQSLINAIPSLVRRSAKGSVNMVLEQACEALDIPTDVLPFLSYPTRFDNTQAKAALSDTNIDTPELEEYAQQLWDFWSRHLDPDRDERAEAEAPSKRLETSVQNKVILVTGATSGIGKAAAMKLAAAGAIVAVAARTPEKLEETLHEIAQLGGQAYAYRCDIANMDECDKLIADIVKDHGKIDVLVNNAGRSIRRSVVHSLDRFHDFERTMQLNYFGALRLILNAIPHMAEQGQGQIINISSIGVLTSAPRFSAYVASKSALDSFSRVAAGELAHQGIRFTTINMPLVRTPMIAPTKLYNHVPTISPNQAADLICDAIVRQPKRIATGLGITGQIMHFLAPKATETVLNTGYKLFADSAAAMGKKEQTPKSISREQAVFSRIFKGIHW